MSMSEDQEIITILEVSPDGRFIKYDEVLSKSPFKVVYKGFDKVDGIEVAWYQISINDDDDKASEFHQTLMKSESLNHKNIIKCYSSWIDDANMNINMITELFSSGSLRKYMNKHKSVVDIRVVVKNWCKQVLMGLNYLHSQEPPIIHKDLSCDNVFINGNTRGDVKIGNLGIGTLMMHYGTARNFVGRPEFMAPELYDDDGYNELVDIYSFGMCMLELVTCECPYGECKNLAQIFKKVATGVKPLALGKVQDPQIKEFIDKCLVPASERLSAAELLKDPLFLPLSSEEILCESLLLPELTTNVPVPVPELDSQACTSIGSSCGMFSRQASFSSINEKTLSDYDLEYWRSSEQIQLRLRGKRIDNREISFSLLIRTDFGSSVANSFKFVFDIEVDDAHKIAMELVQIETLAHKNVPLVVELIDSMLLELEPGWKPCSGDSKAESSYANISVTVKTSIDGDSTSLKQSVESINKMNSPDQLDHAFESINKKNSPDLDHTFESIKKRNHGVKTMKRSSSLDFKRALQSVKNMVSPELIRGVESIKKNVTPDLNHDLESFRKKKTPDSCSVKNTISSLNDSVERIKQKATPDLNHGVESIKKNGTPDLNHVFESSRKKTTPDSSSASNTISSLNDDSVERNKQKANPDSPTDQPFPSLAQVTNTAENDTMSLNHRAPKSIKKMDSLVLDNAAVEEGIKKKTSPYLNKDSLERLKKNNDELKLALECMRKKASNDDSVMGSFTSIVPLANIRKQLKVRELKVMFESNCSKVA